jgi:hypothetical protein
MAAAPPPTAPPPRMSTALLTFPSSHPYPSLPAPHGPKPPNLPLAPRVAASHRASASTDRIRALVRHGKLDEVIRIVDSLMGLHPPVHAAAGPCAALIKKLCASGRAADARRFLGACEPDARSTTPSRS